MTPVAGIARPDLIGVFTPARAGALAGVSGDQIGQWARYGLICPTIYEGRPANRYAFNDVAEAIVVHWLRDQDFDYDEIHTAIEAARTDFPDWPLLRAPLGVASAAIDGDRGVIAQRVGKVYVETSRRGGQLVLTPESFAQASDMLRSGGWLARSLRLRRIEVDPLKLGGAPVLRGSRWPIERVAQIAEDPEGLSLLVEDYDLDPRGIDEAVRWTEAAAAL